MSASSHPLVNHRSHLRPAARRSRGFLTAALSCAALLGLACTRATAEGTEPTRKTMHRVFDALAALLPAAVSGSVGDWEARPAAVHTAIDALAAASEQLAEHGVHRDASFRFLSESLATESRMLQRQLERGKYMSASYFTERVVETCIACHLRLPSPRTKDFEHTLLERVDRSALTTFAKANLEMAARQFDAALQTQEEQFRDPAASLDAVDLSSALTSYLIVTLRVKRDAERAGRGLALLAQRRDLAAQVELNLPIWQRALVELAPALREPPSLRRAREILAAGHALSELPFDAADQIHAIVASSIVFRYLEEKQPEGPQLAETLYLLARTEAFTRRSFDLSEAASYLEQAIHAAPHSAIAERAYARLELQSILQYAGPEGMEVPRDVDAWLKELRQLSSTRPRAEPQDPLHDVATAAGEVEL